MEVLPDASTRYHRGARSDRAVPPIVIPPRWQPLLPVLDEFQANLAPQFRRLELTAATDKQWSDAEYWKLRPKGFPSRLRGVYLLFDEDDCLLYVGLAMWRFDKRVWAHDEWIPRRWIDIISLDDRSIFLAPSLEFWLISRIKGLRNRIYRGYAEALERATDHGSTTQQ
jgi:hypothetical protein